MLQRVRFCAAPDGVRLAYAVHGQGPPLVKVANWLTHVEHDWHSPVWRHWLETLGRRHTVVRYDERGCGLSDRDPPEVSLATWIGDLDTVVEAAGFDEFALLGMCEGGMVALSYAARHTEKVRCLVLYGTYGRGRLRRGATQGAREEAEALISLTRRVWDEPTPAYRRLFTNLLIPDGTDEQMVWFDELQRLSSSPAHAARCRRVRYSADVTDLARQVTVPTLVLHSRDDAIVPFEEARLLAALIPDAQLVPLDSANHILLAEEPAFADLDEALHDFLGSHGARAGVTAPMEALSVRELEVLELVAAGMGNDEIAGKLFVSVRTVERHLSNVYRKLGVSGKAGRAAAAVWFSRRASAET